MLNGSSHIILGKTIPIYLVVKYPNNSYEYEALLVVLEGSE